MGDSPENSSIQEDGELSNDGDFSNLFVVDNTPAANVNRIDAPVYDRKFNEVLKVLTEEEKQSKDSKPKRPKPPQNTCWNCGGDHSLRDCTEPRNYEAINRNRVIFMNKQGARGSKASRYHLDDEQKYPHVQPGKISRRLRRALGLQSNQLPRHIYRMRTLGYPPGWVEEARVSHSGLSLFNSEGAEVADPEDEDGEIVAEGAKDKYDTKKIIEYPGFNCPCGANLIDETDRLNSKPMAEKDSIKFMKTMWQPKAVKAYKRRKMNTSDTAGTPNTSVNKKKSLLLLDDMELDSEEGVSSDEEPEIVEIDKGNPDPLEEPSQPPTPQGTKRSGSKSPGPVDAKKHKAVEEEAKISESLVNTGATKDSVSAPREQSTAASSPTTTNSLNLGSVTSVTLGTPVIVTSPFTCLPSADKFSKNICDVINFENLPDSTGKYEKMSGLINKVRSFVSRLNTEEEED